MKTTQVTKTITTLTTWKNESTGDIIQFDSSDKTFYYFTKTKLFHDFPEVEAASYLAMVDDAVKNDLTELELIPDTAFMSMVLTQFLHKTKQVEQ